MRCLGKELVPEVVEIELRRLKERYTLPARRNTLQGELEGHALVLPHSLYQS